VLQSAGICSSAASATAIWSAAWPEVKRLMTVPGVNVIVAATFMAAIGDIARFPDRRKLTGYLGLGPRLRHVVVPFHEARYGGLTRPLI
jgi:transposase